MIWCETGDADAGGSFDGATRALGEKSGIEAGSDAAEGGESGCVEGEDNDGKFAADATETSGERAEQGIGHVGFDFEIEAEMEPGEKGEGFVESGNALAGEGGIEPGAGVEFSDGGEGHLVEATAGVGGATDAGVVEENETAVGGDAEVGFDGVGAESGSETESGERVFRGVGGSAAMGDEERARRHRNHDNGGKKGRKNGLLTFAFSSPTMKLTSGAGRRPFPPCPRS